jgi:hypothetical protein
MRYDVPYSYKTAGLDRICVYFNLVSSTVQMGSFQCLIAMQNNVLVGMPETKRQFEEPKRRWGDNINVSIGDWLCSSSHLHFQHVNQESA